MEVMMMDESQPQLQHQNQQQAQTQTQAQKQPPSTKRKAESGDPRDRDRDRGTVIHFTSRNPLWTYLKLQLITHPLSSSSAATTLDAVTARTYLTSALSQFLGVTGTAIPIDILKIEKVSPPSRRGESVVVFMWIRVPREDASAVVSALSSWIGGSTSSSSSGAAGGGNVAWRVCAKGNFLGAVVHGSGSELFQP